MMSDMFTAVSAGFQSASHVDHVQLVAGFLGQREQFGLVALDPWTQKMDLHASCDGALLLAPSTAGQGGDRGGGGDDVSGGGIDRGADAGDAGGVMITDWAVLVWPAAGAEHDAPLRQYMDAVGEHLGARLPLRDNPRTLTPTPPPGGGGVGGGGERTPTVSPPRSGVAAGSPPRNGGRGDGSKDEMLTGWCSWYELMDKVYI